MGQHFALTFVTFSAVVATKLRAMNSRGVPPPVGVYSFRHGPCQHLVHILLVSWIQITFKKKKKLDTDRSETFMEL